MRGATTRLRLQVTDVAIATPEEVEQIAGVVAGSGEQPSPGERFGDVGTGGRDRAVGADSCGTTSTPLSDEDAGDTSVDPLSSMACRRRSVCGAGVATSTRVPGCAWSEACVSPPSSTSPVNVSTALAATTRRPYRCLDRRRRLPAPAGWPDQVWSWRAPLPHPVESRQESRGAAKGGLQAVLPGTPRSARSDRPTVQEGAVPNSPPLDH